MNANMEKQRAKMENASATSSIIIYIILFLFLYMFAENVVLAKRAHAHQTHKPAQHKAPGDQNINFGKDIKLGGGGKGGDILGHHGRYIKQVDNNVVYGVGALLLLGGGYFAYSNGLLNNLPFISGLFTPAAPTSVIVSPNPVAQGTGVTATGSFSPAAPATFYSVFNSAGALVLSGTLGTNVTTFSTPLATQSLPLGSYTMTVSDKPIPTTGPSIAGASPAGAVLGTNTQLAMNFVPTSTTTNENLGASPASGPSNITLG
jgi:hypothetical protein